MITPELLKFVEEARKRGFNDEEISKPLIKEGWKKEDVSEALRIVPIYKYKEKVTIYLDSSIMKIVKQRAKKNFLTIEEQIEDIIRRSSINLRKMSKPPEKIDDLLVSIFSRRKYSKK